MSRQHRDRVMKMYARRHARPQAVELASALEPLAGRMLRRSIDLEHQELRSREGAHADDLYTLCEYYVDLIDEWVETGRVTKRLI